MSSPTPNSGMSDPYSSGNDPARLRLWNWLKRSVPPYDGMVLRIRSCVGPSLDMKVCSYEYSKLYVHTYLESPNIYFYMILSSMTVPPVAHINGEHLFLRLSSLMLVYASTDLRR